MTLKWSFKRQILPHASKNLPESIYDGVLESFACSNLDEYRVEGEMMMALPPFVAKFSPGLCHGCLLGVADEDGHLQLLNTSKSGHKSIVKGWSAHSNAVFDIAWVNMENKLVTASGDQTARLWDIDKSETVGIFRGHTCSLKSVYVQPHSSYVFATGARDGNVMIWDTRCCMKNGYFGPVRTISGAHKVDIKTASPVVNKKRKPRRLSMLQDSQQSVTSVIFQDDVHMFTAGACDGLIKMWDVRKINSNKRIDPLPVHSIPFAGQGLRRHGYTCLFLDSTRSRLFASCTNDTVYMYHTFNLGTKPHAQFTGHQASTFYIKAGLSPDDRYLVSGSGDSNVYIWNVDKPERKPWILKGHCGEVTSVSWCPTDIGKIASCSDDNTFRIWRSKSMCQDYDDDKRIVGTCKRSDCEDSVTDTSSCADCDRNSLWHGSNLRAVFHSDRCLNCRRKKERWHENELRGNKSCKENGLKSRNASPTSTLCKTPSSEIKPPSTPRDSKSLMETWLKSPTVRQKETNLFPEPPKSPIIRTCSRGSPLSERNEIDSQVTEDPPTPRSIMVALKSPRDSDLMKGRKRLRSTSNTSSTRQTKRKREPEKENTPSKVQKLVTSFTTIQTETHTRVKRDDHKSTGSKTDPRITASETLDS